MSNMEYGKHETLTPEIFEKYGYKKIRIQSPASQWKDVVDVELTEEDLCYAFKNKNNILIDVWLPYGLEIGYQYNGNGTKDFTGAVKDEESFVAVLKLLNGLSVNDDYPINELRF